MVFDVAELVAGSWLEFIFSLCADQRRRNWHVDQALEHCKKAKSSALV
jgi:hypothetical protein